MQNLIISIPKPCHEDWGKMSVEERGRFCGKCCKTVVDFSNKTTSEIQQYVSTHRDEKLCGHFSNDQLNQPVTIKLPVPASFRICTPLQLFAVALLITFGTSLFSCTTPQGNTVGLIEFTAVEPAGNIIPPELDTFPPVLGGISSYEVPADTENPIKGEPIVTCGLKGKIAIEPETLFTTLPEVEIEALTGPLVSYVTTGVIMVEINETNEAVTPGTEAVTLREETGEIMGTPVDFNTLIYPNPTNGLLHIDINAEKEEFAEADLYDLAGKYVSNLLTKQIVRPGRNKFELNISGNSPGIYLLKTVIGTKSKTEKVVLENR
ncbi:MAG: T9SS type A sorting domain-containing protein [Bacteroidia bacterium]